MSVFPSFSVFSPSRFHCPALFQFSAAAAIFLQIPLDKQKKMWHNIICSRQEASLSRRPVSRFYMRVWRNWQTRKIQVLMVARLCRFKSCHPHQKKTPSKFAWGLLLVWMPQGWSPGSLNTAAFVTYVRLITASCVLSSFSANRHVPLAAHCSTGLSPAPEKSTCLCKCFFQLNPPSSE